MSSYQPEIPGDSNLALLALLAGIAARLELFGIFKGLMLERFVGRSATYMHQEIERHLGPSVEWEAEFESRYREVYKRELATAPGVVVKSTALSAFESAVSHSNLRVRVTFQYRIRNRRRSASFGEHAIG